MNISNIEVWEDAKKRGLELGVHPAGLRREALKKGVYKNKNRDLDFIMEVLDLISDGIPMEKVARDYLVEPSTIHRWLGEKEKGFLDYLVLKKKRDEVKDVLKEIDDLLVELKRSFE